MKRTWVVLIIALALSAVSAAVFTASRSDGKTANEAPSGDAPRPAVVAAPGLVEPASEEIEVGAEIPGKLARVLVEEGAAVTAGQTIAVIENADLASAVTTARAEVQTLVAAQQTAAARIAERKAERARVVNGSRREERLEAEAAFEATLPNVENTRREMERAGRLFRTGDVSREEYERAQTAHENAKKISATARERFNLVNAEARPDDVARAEAAVRLAETELLEFGPRIAAAEARVREAEARLEKTIVRSPITGLVLRKRLKDGESVSPESQLGIVTVADRSSLRVRVDLDETDVARIAVGQRAYVTADAYRDTKFAGRVVSVGQILGRKNFTTERPTERVDTRVLEVLIELDAGQMLPLGLRVDTFIETGETNAG
ncbi:MAG: efflux RND transporter periplasmic adaptor subunit [Acidobacteria bacterium]|nr:efflux RND transporter periplasmic adaptor subunit [Acidobacteriota bacterium]